jgi:crossover junction endodeoxyribonuclease RuvC
MNIIGIDPGLNGALAFYRLDINELYVFDMPTVEVMRGGKKKRELHINVLAEMLELPGQNKVAFLERVGAMPGQGVSSTFAFGRNVGAIEGVLAALRIPVTIVPPQTWQKAMNVRDGKDGSRLRASEVFPHMSATFARVKDDGRADAALIAKYGERVLQK